MPRHIRKATKRIETIYGKGIDDIVKRKPGEPDDSNTTFGQIRQHLVRYQISNSDNESSSDGIKIDPKDSEEAKSLK